MSDLIEIVTETEISEKSKDESYSHIDRISNEIETVEENKNSEDEFTKMNYIELSPEFSNDNNSNDGIENGDSNNNNNNHNHNNNELVQTEADINENTMESEIMDKSVNNIEATSSYSTSDSDLESDSDDKVGVYTAVKSKNNLFDEEMKRLQHELDKLLSENEMLIDKNEELEKKCIELIVKENDFKPKNDVSQRKSSIVTNKIDVDVLLNSNMIAEQEKVYDQILNNFQNVFNILEKQTAEYDKMALDIQVQLDEKESKLKIASDTYYSIQR
jgi:hypothetical protein